MFSAKNFIAHVSTLGQSYALATLTCRSLVGNKDIVAVYVIPETIYTYTNTITYMIVTILFPCSKVNKVKKTWSLITNLLSVLVTDSVKYFYNNSNW